MATRALQGRDGARLGEVLTSTVHDHEGSHHCIAVNQIGLSPRGLHPDEARALADMLLSAAKEVERLYARDMKARKSR